MSKDKEPNRSSTEPTHREGGINVGGNIYAKNVAGRDLMITENTGVSPEEFYTLFQPLKEIVEQAPPEVQPEAEEQYEALVDETVKGENADDGKMAGIINSLVELLPGAVSAVVSMFASPVLSGLVGPVTKIVLKQFGAG